MKNKKVRKRDKVKALKERDKLLFLGIIRQSYL